MQRIAVLWIGTRRLKHWWLFLDPTRHLVVGRRLNLKVANLSPISCPNLPGNAAPVHISFHNNLFLLKKKSKDEKESKKRKHKTDKKGGKERYRSGCLPC